MLILAANLNIFYCTVHFKDDPCSLRASVGAYISGLTTSPTLPTMDQPTSGSCEGPLTDPSAFLCIVIGELLTHCLQPEAVTSLSIVLICR